MKKIISVFMLMMCSHICHPVLAQNTMERFLTSTPDNIFHSVSNEMFAQLIDYVQVMKKGDAKGTGFQCEIVNRFGEKTLLDTISADYASLAISKALRVQMMVLPVNNTDSIVCVVKTFHAPEPESVVSFYDLEWHPLQTSDYLTFPSTEELYARPDTMAVEQYAELVKMIDPVMVHADVIPSQKMLVFSLATPLLNQDEISQLNAILLQRKVKWSGNAFNNC